HRGRDATLSNLIVLHGVCTEIDGVRRDPRRTPRLRREPTRVIDHAMTNHMAYDLTTRVTSRLRPNAEGVTGASSDSPPDFVLGTTASTPARVESERVVARLDDGIAPHPPLCGHPARPLALGRPTRHGRPGTRCAGWPISAAHRRGRSRWPIDER